LAIEIEKASAGAVRVEDLRPDVDWAYIRSSAQSIADSDIVERVKASDDAQNNPGGTVDDDSKE
jgi:DNA-binding transcriptional regulator YdaS (Cro superfamily)